MLCLLVRSPRRRGVLGKALGLPGGACHGTPFLNEYPITAKESPFCVDLAPGLALGSKAMTAPTYTPGACTPHGGEETGSVTETGPATFCCLQS